MIYELILTTSCTRKCSFCYVKQTAFSISYTDVDNFYNEIKKDNNTSYTISLFGGEPLLNINIVKYAIEKFKDENCKIMLYTNADLIDNLKNYEYLNRIYISITTYDIFIDIDKYKKILDTFDKSRCRFSYTFDETNLNLVNNFIKICTELQVKYKIAFSHSINSWKSLSAKQIFQTIYDLYLVRINNFIHNNLLNKNSLLDMQLELLLKKQIELNTSPNIKEVTCIDTKKTFYNGKFIGHCIRCLYQPIIYNNLICSDCKYKAVCSKGCIAEHMDTVPEKLCSIEKAGFSATNLLFNDKKFVNIIFNFLEK
jgi:organic radical activating enzyme